MPFIGSELITIRIDSRGLLIPVLEFLDVGI